MYVLWAGWVRVASGEKLESEKGRGWFVLVFFICGFVVLWVL
jgi:hypothetical protein